MKSCGVFLLFFFLFLSLPCPCPGIFPGNKRCERIADHAKKGGSTTLTVTIAQCVRQ